MPKKSWKMMKKWCKKWSKSNGKLMQNLIDCKKTDLHFDYEKPTIFQYFRVRAGQNTRKKQWKKHWKIASKKSLKKHRKIMKKVIKKWSKIHEKIHQKNDAKNDAKKEPQSVLRQIGRIPIEDTEYRVLILNIEYWVLSIEPHISSGASLGHFRTALRAPEGARPDLKGCALPADP